MTKASGLFMYAGIVCVLVFSTITQADEAAVKERIGEIERFLQQRQAPQALQAAEALIADYPDSALALVTRAKLHFMMNQMPQGQQRIDEALEAEPYYPDAVALRVTLLQRMHQYDAATALLDEAVQARPDNVELLVMRGEIHTNVQEYDKAQALFNRAGQHAETNMQWARIHLALAGMYQQQFEMQQAEKAMSNAIVAIEQAKRAGETPEAWNQQELQLVMGRADMRLQLKRFADAQKDFIFLSEQPAVKQHPQALQQVMAKLKEANTGLHAQQQAAAAERGERIKSLIDAYRRDVNAKVNGKPVADLIVEEVLAFDKQTIDRNERLILIPNNPPRTEPMAGAPQDIREKYNAAHDDALKLKEAYADRDDYDVLIAQAPAVLAVYPMPEILQNLGAVYFVQGDYEQALRYGALALAVTAAEVAETPGSSAHSFVRTPTRLRNAVRAYRQMAAGQITDEDLQWIPKFLKAHEAGDALAADDALYVDRPQPKSFSDEPLYASLLVREHLASGHYDQAELRKAKTLAMLLAQFPEPVAGERVWLPDDGAERFERRGVTLPETQDVMLMYLRARRQVNEEASEAYEKRLNFVLERYPFSQVAWFLQGLDALKANQPDAAMLCFLTAKIAPQIVGERPVGPDNFYGQGVRDETNKQYERLQARYPDTKLPEALYNLGLQAEQAGERANLKGYQYRPMVIAALEENLRWVLSDEIKANRHLILAYNYLNLDERYSIDLGESNQFLKAIEHINEAQRLVGQGSAAGFQVDVQQVIGLANLRLARQFDLDEADKPKYLREAASAFEQVNRIAPKIEGNDELRQDALIESHMNLGETYTRLEAPAKAIEAYTWVINNINEADRRTAEAAYFRAKLAFENELLDAATIKADAKAAHDRVSREPYALAPGSGQRVTGNTISTFHRKVQSELQ